MKLRLRPELSDTHRPWPVPKRPWIMVQTWSNLLFAHWPIDPDLLRPDIPVQNSTRHVPRHSVARCGAIRLSALRFRGIPEIGPVSNFTKSTCAPTSLSAASPASSS